MHLAGKIEVKRIFNAIFMVLFCAYSFRVTAYDSLPPKINGPIGSSEQAIEAVEYFSARESSLGPCGKSNVAATRVGNEWLVLVTVEGHKTKTVSWRVWQIDAMSGEYVNVTNFNWKINIQECKNA